MAPSLHCLGQNLKTTVKSRRQHMVDTLIAANHITWVIAHRGWWWRTLHTNGSRARSKKWKGQTYESPTNVGPSMCYLRVASVQVLIGIGSGVCTLSRCMILTALMADRGWEGLRNVLKEGGGISELFDNAVWSKCTSALVSPTGIRLYFLSGNKFTPDDPSVGVAYKGISPTRLRVDCATYMTTLFVPDGYVMTLAMKICCSASQSDSIRKNLKLAFLSKRVVEYIQMGIWMGTYQRKPSESSASKKQQSYGLFRVLSYKGRSAVQQESQGVDLAFSGRRMRALCTGGSGTGNGGDDDGFGNGDDDDDEFGNEYGGDEPECLGGDFESMSVKDQAKAIRQSCWSGDE
ncbi:hypothetical protein EDB85DRAFT_2273562 [Lactarius pseudohatsudake]|nr:hypothetical protein EDB85DRAFT_2273562 [Lactarius pseudohatsudake]